MKTLLLFVSILLFTSIKAQDSTKIEERAEKLTAERIYKDVKEGFSNLVTNLEGPAKHVYKVYINQHLTKGVVLTISWVIFFIFPFIMLLKFMLGGKKGDLSSEDGKDLSAKGILCIVFAIISFIGLIHLTFTFNEGLQKLLNPEYYAIQDVIKAFK